MSRILITSCSATKLGEPAEAAEFYQGQLFKLVKRYAELSTPRVFAAWAIVSAKHGLVMPSQVVEPYDMSLGSLSSAERSAWRDRVRQELVNQWGAGAIYSVYAGADYAAALRGLPMVEYPFREWARVHRETGSSSRWGLGHIKRRMGRELARAEEVADIVERYRKEAQGGAA